MLLSEAWKQFLVAREVDGKAKATISLNKWAGERIIKYAGDMPLKKFDALAMDKVMLALKNGEYAPSSINTLLTSVSLFCRWARSRGLMGPDQDPIAGRTHHKNPARHRNRLKAHQFSALLDTAKHPRDRFLIAAGLFLFLRQSEAISLRVGDVDIQEGTVKVVIHKTNEIDTFVIPPELRPELMSWLTYYTNEVGVLDPEYYLIPACKPPTPPRWESKLKPMSKMSNASTVVRRILTDFGFPTRDENGKTLREGMHTLRRSAAREFFTEHSKDSSVDATLRTTMSLLHHRSVTTTERYLGLEADRETRNKMLSQRPLYPSLQKENVVDLQAVRDAAM